MTKSQLKKWLEQKRADALSEVTEQYRKAVELYEEERNTEIELVSYAEEIAKLISKADDLIDDFKKKIITVEGIDNVSWYYGSLTNILSSYSTVAECKSGLLNEFRDISKKKLALSNKKNEMTVKINENYNNVIANVSNMKNAKAAILYLQELGFDLSELIKADEHSVTTALSVPVDKSYLFVGGVVNET